jgi:cytochrome c oxidase subunit 4
MSDVNTHEANHSHGTTITTAHIWKIFWILLAITMVEVVWGMKVSHHISYKWVNALFFLSMTFVKAGYIVAEFMHLRYEVTNMLRSVLIPLLLFIWFVVAFCLDGQSWWNLRDKYLPGDKPEKAKTEVEAPSESPVLK